ncbi:MAG: carboxypeptidase M32 [Fimbriiglobus sp.]
MANGVYAELLTRTRELAVLQSCSAVLGWDQQTYLPSGGAAFRGDQLQLLAAMCHEKATDPRLGELLANLQGVAAEDDWATANVREAAHAYNRAVKLPKRLVEELAKVTSDAHEAWAVARRESNFALFQPHLEKIVALKREEANAVGFTTEAYDALLDEYEPGATAQEIEGIFAGLTKSLVPLIQHVSQSGRKPRPGLLERDYPIDRQRWFAESAASAIGFDFTQGRLDTTTHPFCSGMGPGDCRLTTRYNPRFFNEAFFGVMHEAGHGIYEQNLPRERWGQPAGVACSLGIHESQSRLWENQVGRSESFWNSFYPRLRQAFPGTLEDVPVVDFLFAINEVKPSFIRVEADEATYNLHIVLRFELERALLSGNLQVADLPGAWNERFHKLFGLVVPSDREGCLQDIHWSFGGLGYFPTYTLGNLYAAQFMTTASMQISGLDDAIRHGDFSGLKSWLTANIHQHGRRVRASELCLGATGHLLDSAEFTAYLREKLARYYGVC